MEPSLPTPMQSPTPDARTETLGLSEAAESAGFLSAPYFCDTVTHVEAPGNTTVARPLVNPCSLVPALYVYIYINVHLYSYLFTVIDLHTSRL